MQRGRLYELNCQLNGQAILNLQNFPPISSCLEVPLETSLTHIASASTNYSWYILRHVRPFLKWPESSSATHTQKSKRASSMNEQSDIYIFLDHSFNSCFPTLTTISKPRHTKMEQAFFAWAHNHWSRSTFAHTKISPRKFLFFFFFLLSNFLIPQKHP